MTLMPKLGDSMGGVSPPSSCSGVDVDLAEERWPRIERTSYSSLFSHSSRFIHILFQSFSLEDANSYLWAHKTRLRCIYKHCVIPFCERALRP